MQKTTSHSPDADTVRRAIDRVERLLEGRPLRYMLAPVPWTPSALTPFSCPVVLHASDPDSRSDLLARIRIVKTVEPGIRDVLLDGAKVGRIAACPWGPGWMASSTRARVFWSMDDAALAVVGVTP